MPQHLQIHSLTKAAFAPFGDVIKADPATVRLINNGTTERFHRLGTVETEGEGAIISLFRGQPRQFPYAIDMMERHPFGSQSFHPLSGRPFLVAVAEDVGSRPGEPKIFLARGDQGVNYRRNVWHHPLMVIGSPSDFLVVDRDRPENNLEESFYDTRYLISEPIP